MNKPIVLLSWIALVVFYGMIITLFLSPQGNRIVWTVLIPLVPITIVLIGYSRWRLVCPLGWFSQLAQNHTYFKKQSLSVWFEHNFYLFQFSLLYIALVARLVILNFNPFFLGLFFVGIIAFAFVSGALFRGKTWCNYLCPVGVVEKIYTSSNVHRYHLNSACTACSACKKNCPDIDAESSYWKEIGSDQKRMVFYAFPGLVLGFYLYYFLETGSWDNYFDGAWVSNGSNIGVWESITSEGFYFWPQCPKIVASAITLLFTSLASFGLFTKLEGALLVCDWIAHKGAKEIRHITSALAAFVAFNLFYLFAGAPTFNHYPLLYTGFQFLIIMVSSIALWREIPREERFFIQERFARTVLKKWNGKNSIGKNPKEVYYTYANKQYDRKQLLENYQEAVLELLGDGILTNESLQLLEKMRDQLGISLQEHRDMINNLKKEYTQLFDETSLVPSEKLYQIKSYKKMIQQSLDENKIMSPKELEKMRQHFGITIQEHETIIDELMHNGTTMNTKIREALEELLHYYQISAYLPDESIASINYLKFCLIKELEVHLAKVYKMLPLMYSDVQIMELIELFHSHGKLERELKWLEEPFFALVHEIVQAKNSSPCCDLVNLKSAILMILEGKLNPLVAPVALVLRDSPHQTSIGLELYWSQLFEVDLEHTYRCSLIHAAPLLSSLIPKDVQVLAHTISVSHFKPFDVIIQQGDIGETLYFIIHGDARILLNDQEIAIVTQDDYVGEIALYSGGCHSASVVAITDMEVLMLSMSTLKEVMYCNPSVGFDMMRQITLRLMEQKNHSST